MLTIMSQNTPASASEQLQTAGAAERACCECKGGRSQRWERFQVLETGFASSPECLVKYRI